MKKGVGKVGQSRTVKTVKPKVHDLSHLMRKYVFGVSKQVQQKPGCTTYCVLLFTTVIFPEWLNLIF